MKAEIGGYLDPGLHMQVTTPGEFVFVQGLQGSDMFFVQQGLLEVRQSKSHLDVQRLLQASSHYAQRMRSAKHSTSNNTDTTSSAGWLRTVQDQIIPV